MIIVEEKSNFRDPQLVVIRQTDHAFLTGFFAREWGNEVFSKPEPNASFCLAAAEHDNGWTDWELQPSLDYRTQLPYSFMSIPTADHIALYRKGLDRLARADHYAALLVSIHVMGLYDRARATMPGYSAKYVKGEEVSLANEFVQQLRLQQLRLKVDLRSNPATKAVTEETLIKANAARLEALDRLSLHFCLNAAQDATIDAVPVNDAGVETDLEIHAEGANVIAIAPYPFRRDPLPVSIMTRRIPSRVYANDGEFQKTLAAAQFTPLRFTLRARRGSAFTKVAGF
ncbi:MAG TPA: DUF3891 family protein [Dongiaceae bacterium]|nr:DUF3891 family protein [Dongiaceae bacterium]